MITVSGWGITRCISNNEMKGFLHDHKKTERPNPALSPRLANVSPSTPKKPSKIFLENRDGAISYISFHLCLTFLKCPFCLQYVVCKCLKILLKQELLKWSSSPIVPVQFHVYQYYAQRPRSCCSSCHTDEETLKKNGTYHRDN